MSGSRNSNLVSIADAQSSERRFWKTLEELASDAPAALQTDEFPPDAGDWDDGVSRRDFLRVMSASLAMASLSACTRQPRETIVPYVRQPEELVPGKPLYFATAMSLSGYAIPLLIKSDMGRPIKAEGNPNHPIGNRGTDVFAQASILQLYDPDRSQTPTYLGEVRPWPAFLGAIQGPLSAQRAVRGEGLRILTPTISSPTLAAQLRQLLTTFPAAKWHQYEPVNRDNARAGALAAFGQYVETHYLLENADRIISLDADFLSSTYPGFLRCAAGFAIRRKPESGKPLNRFYAIESTPTNTGAKADHRLRMRASEAEAVARQLAFRILPQAGAVAGTQHPWIEPLLKDLFQHRGRSVIVPGEFQPPSVHALAHAMNQALGNVGQTLYYTDPVEASPLDQLQSLRDLVANMRAGAVDVLVILGGNPLYEAPADLDFRGAMEKVPLRVHHGLYHDETAEYCHWHINAAHFLESWSDARAQDGTASIIQPLIDPLYGGKNEHELVAAISGQGEARSYDLVRSYWQSQYRGSDFEVFWRKALHDGFIPNSAPPARKVSARITMPPAAPLPKASGFEINFRPDPHIYDGRFSNNAWLQELAKPLSKLTWDNPAWIGHRTASQLGLADGDEVEIAVHGRKQKFAIWRTPGHPDNSVTVFFGYGRRRAGRVGNGMGFNAFALRGADYSWSVPAQLSKTGGRYHLACTQPHQNMHGRHLVRVATEDDYRRNPKVFRDAGHAPSPELTLYPQYQYTENKWGMAIDINACIGCNACVVACQAENNIPVVGKQGVLQEREMHWLRIDTYHEGEPEDPRTYFQPLPCMHCENAPCEVVCPVNATVHSSEGLNDMVYNRCVGTRYCSNNCPYKVRRFNFLLYQDWTTPQFKLMRNPDVTIRSRGVMEKCTYCVQRISRARIEAQKENRPILDGEVQTACQQACPADAIVFGNLNDSKARISRSHQQARNYGLLEELNTRPRTTYLAAVTNPNPEVEKLTGSAERH